MDSDQRWLAAQWPFVRAHLPVASARVLEIGCGPLGGFVPAARSMGHLAVGVDQDAPDETGYHRVQFEDYRPAEPVDVVVACTSLHHVTDLAHVLDRIREVLTPAGTLVVVEWARERFDEPTARWCFTRLAPDPVEPGWLHRHRDRWMAGGLPWPEYLRCWAAQEGLHTGEQIRTSLDARFHRELYTLGPYFFADLADTSEADEQVAIEHGIIQANGIRYVGQLR